MNAKTNEIAATVLNAYDEYVLWTQTVAQYPVTAEAYYLAMGMMDECGELQRADDQRDDQAVLAEAGDVLWYASRYATRVLGLKFSLVVDQVRKERHSSLTGPRILLVNLATIAGIEKKRIRDCANWDDGKLLSKTAEAYAALREVLNWTFSRLYNHNLTILDAMTANQRKLTKRLDEGTIKGDGDYR